MCWRRTQTQPRLKTGVLCIALWCPIEVRWSLNFLLRLVAATGLRRQGCAACHTWAGMMAVAAQQVLAFFVLVSWATPAQAQAKLAARSPSAGCQLGRSISLSFCKMYWCRLLRARTSQASPFPVSTTVAWVSADLGSRCPHGLDVEF